MLHMSTPNKPAMQKPRNKANMDEPQEEFIDPESAHPNHDRGHGHEIRQPAQPADHDAETTEADED